MGKLKIFAKRDAHSPMGRKALSILQCIAGPAKAPMRSSPEPIDKANKSDNFVGGKPLHDYADQARTQCQQEE